MARGIRAEQAERGIDELSSLYAAGSGALESRDSRGAQVLFHRLYVLAVEREASVRERRPLFADQYRAQALGGLATALMMEAREHDSAAEAAGLSSAAEAAIERSVAAACREEAAHYRGMLPTGRRAA